jgi:serine/threonine protein kinase
VTISDKTINRLQEVVYEPDLSGTRYRILGIAGHGGMGTVFEAEDTTLHRRVALKVIQPSEAFLDPNAVDRLLDEARILARLEHPGIVPVHDAGVLADGNVFYTMKFVQGQRLDAYAAANTSVSDLLRVFQKVCDAVAFSHAQGIIHRDLKPENIMVGTFGEVLVMDWGVATVLNGRREPAGTIVGTPDYMAPEQTRGAVHEVDKRTDVFGLGAILQFLISNRKASKSLRAIAAKGKATSPDDRYGSAADMVADIQRYLDGLPVEVYRESVIERSARIIANNRMAFTLIVAYLMMRVLVFFLLSR